MMKDYIISDYYRYWGKTDPFLLVIVKALLGLNHAFTLQFWFRLAQGSKGMLNRIAYLEYKYYCNKHCIYMPLDVVVGYGLYMGHCMCMVIAGGTQIGNNCNLSQFLNIGSNEGVHAIIADNVYIAPHVCVVENVQIGEGAVIGAGAVVVSDVHPNTTVAGVPARVISNNSSNRFLKRKWQN